MLIRKLLLFLVILTTSVTNAQSNRSELYSTMSYYTSPGDSLNFSDVILKFKEGEFKSDKDFKIYQRLSNKEWWFHFPVENKSNSNSYKYLTLSYPYLSMGKVYYKKGEHIDSLHTTSYDKHFPFKFLFYRHPVWKIPIKDSQITDVFLKVKNDSSRARMEFHLEDENDFLKRLEIEYILFGVFISLILSMVIILLYFSILKKEYSVIFYAIYVALMLIEFLAGKGLGIQFLWNDSIFLIHSSRSFSQTLGVFFIGLFYMNFYRLEKQDKFSRNVFRIGTYITVPLILIYIYKSFFGGLTTYYLYVWIILKLIILSWFINHIYLTIKGRIPKYLIIGFSLPIIVLIIAQSINPSVNSNDVLVYGSINVYYLALIAEVLIFIRYIFSAVIASQKKYTELKKVTNELQLNFQKNILKSQEKERSKLLGNVHDSFGGYLEALKLRLLNKSENSPEKVKEILDSFDKEYRYLLNSLYSPKINSENFIENLIDFFDKINKLTNNPITHKFSLEESELPPEKCLHIYRIISELTTNAIKYSKASEIKVNISESKGKVIIVQVSDNGIGFDVNSTKKSSYGLNSIRERVEIMNGEFNIDSIKNSGTTITIRIPEK